MPQPMVETPKPAGVNSVQSEYNSPGTTSFTATAALFYSDPGRLALLTQRLGQALWDPVKSMQEPARIRQAATRLTILLVRFINPPPCCSCGLAV